MLAFSKLLLCARLCIVPIWLKFLFSYAENTMIKKRLLWNWFPGMWNYYDSFPAKSNITSVNEKMDLKPEHNIITGLKSVDLKGELSFIKSEQ